MMMNHLTNILLLIVNNNLHKTCMLYQISLHVVKIGYTKLSDSLLSQCGINQIYQSVFIFFV